MFAIVLACSLGACGGSSATHSSLTSTASYQTLLGAGVKLLSQGNTGAAQQLFEQAVTKNPSDPVAHYNLGVVYQGAGDRVDALRQYNKALLANSRYVPALYNKATLLSQRSPALAIFYYRQVTQIQRNSPTAFLNLGLLESQSGGLHKEAVRDLRRAVQLNPTLRGRVPPSLRADLGASAGAGRKSATHR